MNESSDDVSIDVEDFAGAAGFELLGIQRDADNRAKQRARRSF